MIKLINNDIDQNIKNLSRGDDLQVRGYWFEPSSTDKQTFGILNQNKLEIFLKMDSANIVGYLKNQGRRIPILYGIGEKTVTLMNVYSVGKKFDSSIHIETYGYVDIILGLHYKNSDRFTKISFVYPFVWGPYKKQNLKDMEQAVHFKVNKTAIIDDEIQLEICQNIDSISHSILEDKITQSEFFQIKAKTGIKLGKIVKYLLAINHFLSLCTGKTIYPKHIHLTPTNSDGFEYIPFWLRNYHQKNPIDLNVINFNGIKFLDIQDNFESIIQEWVKIWFKTTEIMYDFFNVSESIMSTNTGFTEYSHVLQRFYDAFESERKNFKEKICWYLDFCPKYIRDNICKNNFVDKIVQTRNYNVHGNKKKHVVKDKELIYLQKDLKTLVEVFLISQLPINNKDLAIKQIYELNSHARNNPIK